MAVVSDGRAMLAAMTPELRPGRFVFATFPGGAEQARMAQSVAMFREAEGVSLILPEGLAAEGSGQTGAPVLRQITLNVYSALEGVGLTAAVAGVLAGAGIACNMVAAFHHDHVFVPADRADEALALLVALQGKAALE